jgi:transcription initiation factor IIE alpha subunit
MLEKDGSIYKVLLFKMVEKMVQQCVLQWISTKYGMDARKIMALLFEGNYFEPKNVAKKCVMDEKDANQVLYRLMNDGLVSFQDMTPAGNYFPYYCTYLYTCNKVTVVHHARKAAMNGYFTFHSLKTEFLFFS